MMTRHLFLIISMCMCLISPMTQAADITVPSYQVDVTHSVIGNGSGDIVAAVAVQPAETMRMQSVANIKLEPAALIDKVVSQHNSHESIAVSTFVVRGGYIGIGKPS